MLNIEKGITDRTTVRRSLIIKYLKENKEHQDILPTKIENCFYTVSDMIPNDQGTY